MEFHAEIEKKQRGGARDVAGRKRKGVHYYGFRATQEVHDILSKVEGSKADYIEFLYPDEKGHRKKLIIFRSNGTSDK